jgi:hypothetical protein
MIFIDPLSNLGEIDYSSLATDKPLGREFNSQILKMLYSIRIAPKKKQI